MSAFGLISFVNGSGSELFCGAAEFPFCGR
jgi:hypothetical protein